MRVQLGMMLSLFLMGIAAPWVNVEHVSADAKTWTVDDDGQADFHMVQEAVDAASSGDMIYVRSGTYYENVVVNKTLSLIGENRSTTIIDANGTDAALQIYADSVSVSGFTVRNSLKPGYGFGDGIALHSSRNTIRENIIEDSLHGLYVDKSRNTISNNEVRNNFDGIRLTSSFDNTVDRNNITFSKWNGLALSRSNRNMVSGNTLKSNHIMSIVLTDSDENHIVGNIISGNENGIWLDESEGNTLGGNTVSSNHLGLALRLSGGNTLRDNNLTGNVYNFGVYQYLEYNLSHFMNDIDPSNMVDGRPIYYLVNQHDKQVPEDAGYVAIVNSTNIIVRNLNLTKNWQGVLLTAARNSVISGLSVSSNYEGFSVFFSNNILIANNTLTRNWDGMTLYQSDSITIARNEVTWHGGEGINLWNSSYNIVEKNAVVSIGKFGIHLLNANNNFVGVNDVSECSHDYPGWGVHIYSSGNNTIWGNNLRENGSPSWDKSGGVCLEYSDDNIISHNNFLGNKRQAFSYNSENTWDDGYPSGGNYWSDYAAVDQFKGRFQNVTGSDGIGDAAYVIDEANRDRYPLMKPWTSPPILGRLQILEPENSFVAGGSLDIAFTITNIGDLIEFEKEDAYNRIDLEIEFKSQNLTVQLWTTTSDGLRLASGETFVKTITYNISSAGVYGDVDIALVHWKYDPASEAYDVGEFGKRKVTGVFTPSIPSEVATVDINPDVLHLGSKGRWVTAHIEFPQGYEINDIDITSIVWNRTVLVDNESPMIIGDYDGDNAPDLMVKFDRADVISQILSNVNRTELAEKRFITLIVTIAGRFNDGIPFQASDSIRVIS